MTAQLFAFPRRAPRLVPIEQRGLVKVPAMPVPAVKRPEEAEAAKQQTYAEERLRDAIRIYRAVFSCEDLVIRLKSATKDELRLIEGAR
jgi:hypothetical protein